MDYEQKYKSLVEKAKDYYHCGLTCSQPVKEVLADLFPELKKSEGESLIEHLKELEEWKVDIDAITPLKNPQCYRQWIDWLKKQKVSQIDNFSIIQWKGNNLKEVLAFTGKAKGFNNWFASFEDYKSYVSSHNNIFKLFNEDGSHYEIPVGSWIVRTPDGHNIPSKFSFVPSKKRLRTEYEKGREDAINWIDTNKDNYLDHNGDYDWLDLLYDCSVKE